ncbi:MAG: adenosylcobalamin-dependent ribonucleoside-diphosphate reductase [Natronohydrobacter sp.]|nr:adenosylcobalamin-dependent ribonucleoside-diphosphate reductase [Natronohydrobacter sp.]
MYFEEIKEIGRDRFDVPIAHQIWDMKYRFRRGGINLDDTVDDTWQRVAKAIAQPEGVESALFWESQFLGILDDFQFLPAGRILAGAGTGRKVTLINTFVMQTIPDSIEGICDTLKNAALTMKMGGGLGYDFSTIRPKGTLVAGLDCPAAGPLSAMDICDAMCRMLVEGSGRGAMMGTLRCDHPDIEAFIDAKTDRTRLRNFNLSVLVTDAFMAALEADSDWPLIWQGETVRVVRAKALWRQIMERTYASAEPGVLFIDRMNARNPMVWTETLCTTNSCAEQPLPPNGSCPLGSINLAQLVTDPFTSMARLDLDRLRQIVPVAVRFMDNVIDVSGYPIEAQRVEALAKRRIGLGVTGVADALAMIGLVYGEPEAAAALETWVSEIQRCALEASTALAREKGPFPAFEAEPYLATEAMAWIDDGLRSDIATHGLRNAVLTTIAPTGTTSMFANNVSSGIEPIFAASYFRRVTQPDGSHTTEEVVDYAVSLWRQLKGQCTPLPPAFVTAMDLDPEAHIRMQAAAQRHIDSAISKTVNCPEDISFEDFENVYLSAYRTGCKGCTTYRPNDVTGSVLNT